MSPFLDDSITSYSSHSWVQAGHHATGADTLAEDPFILYTQPTMEPPYSIARNLEQLNASRAARGAPPIQLSRYLDEEEREAEDEDDAADEKQMGEDEETAFDSIEALKTILEREQWTQFGFVVFRTFYQDESLWERFLDEYEFILHEGLSSTRTDIGTESILQRVYMNVVSDECMENKIPAHVALVYRMFQDIGPGLRTKMCLIVDEECMRSVLGRTSQTVPFVKAVDVTLSADSESAFPGVVKVAISSLLSDFYPALINCETVWEIVPKAGDIWTGLYGAEDADSGWEEIQGVLNRASVSH